MSLDEARSGYALDALGGVQTNNYVLIGDNAYGYSFSSLDFDYYSLATDVGHSYTILSGLRSQAFDRP